MCEKQARRVYIFALPWKCPVPQMAKTVNQSILRYFTVGSINQRISEKKISSEREKSIRSRMLKISFKYATVHRYLQSDYNSQTSSQTIDIILKTFL